MTGIRYVLTRVLSCVLYRGIAEGRATNALEGRAARRVAVRKIVCMAGERERRARRRRNVKEERREGRRERWDDERSKEQRTGNRVLLFRPAALFLPIAFYRTRM